MSIFRLSALSLLLAALLGGGAVMPLHAQAALAQDAQDDELGNGPLPQPRSWQSLDPAQREVLMPLRDKWDTLPPIKQSRMMKRAEGWVTLPPAQREEIRQRVARWQVMTPAERKQTRANRLEFQRLPPDERARLHSAFERFQQMPPQQRDALLRQWRAIPPSQRMRWLNESGKRGALRKP
jgi:hypothetical protein